MSDDTPTRRSPAVPLGSAAGRQEPTSEAASAATAAPREEPTPGTDPAAVGGPAVVPTAGAPIFADGSDPEVLTRATAPADEDGPAHRAEVAPDDSVAATTREHLDDDADAPDPNSETTAIQPLRRRTYDQEDVPAPVPAPRTVEAPIEVPRADDRTPEPPTTPAAQAAPAAVAASPAVVAEAPRSEPQPDAPTKTADAPTKAVEVPPAAVRAEGPAEQRTDPDDQRTVETPTPTPAVPTPVAPVTATADAPVAAAPAPRTVYIEQPKAPKKKSNRGFSILISLLATLVFLLVWAGVAAAIIAVGTSADRFGQSFTNFVLSPAFYVPAIAFFIAMVLLSLIINRGGWIWWLLGGLLVAAIVYAGYLGGALLTVAQQITPAEVGDFVSRVALTPLAIGAAFAAREVSIWTGLINAARGRRVKAKNAESRAAYDSEVADRKAEYERAQAGYAEPERS